MEILKVTFEEGLIMGLITKYEMKGLEAEEQNLILGLRVGGEVI